MTIMQVIAMNDLPGDWEMWRCTTASCPQGLVHLQRRSRGEDVWLIHDHPGWVMAATAPVCPTCATALTREPAMTDAMPVP